MRLPRARAAHEHYARQARVSLAFYTHCERSHSFQFTVFYGLKRADGGRRTSQSSAQYFTQSFTVNNTDTYARNKRAQHLHATHEAMLLRELEQLVHRSPAVQS